MAFSGIHELSLEEALPLNDNPQNRSLIGVFEDDSKLLKKYVNRLLECSRQLIHAQAMLTSAASNLSEHLKFYEHQKFPLDCDDESVLTTTVKQLSKFIDDLASTYQIVLNQLNNGMIYPLSKFLDADLNEIESLSEMYHSTSSEYEQITAKYCKTSKKKEYIKQRTELNQEYFKISQKLHKVSLNYFAQFNALQYKRKIAIIEPVLACVHAYRSHFSVGHASLNSSDTNDFVSNIGASIQGVYSDLNKMNQETVNKIEKLELDSEPFYYAEQPNSEMATPPNTTLDHKAGYLYLKSKFAGMVTKWDKVYVFTQSGNLMYVPTGQACGMIMIELDFHVIAQHVDNEDRRCVFQITNGKRSIILQALNLKDRDEWIATIRNIVKEEGYDNKYRKSQSELQSSVTSVENVPSPAISVPRKNHSSSYSDCLLYPKSGPPPTPPCSPMDGLNLDNPIQFDFILQSDEEIAMSHVSEDDTRINPHDDKSLDGNQSFYFTVRLLGSTTVGIDRGDQMVYDTMRQVMAARAIYNVFKMNDSKLILSTKYLKLVDPDNQEVKASFPMHNVSYWASHNENNRLFGFIVRRKAVKGKPSFFCYIFESDESGKTICDKLAEVAQIALQNFIEQKTSKINQDMHSLKEEDEKEVVLKEETLLVDNTDT